jgi:hypothetical protein
VKLLVAIVDCRVAHLAIDCLHSPAEEIARMPDIPVGLRVMLTGEEDNTGPDRLADSIRHGVSIKGFKLTDVQNPALASGN